MTQLAGDELNAETKGHFDKDIALIDTGVFKIQDKR
jgi:hypothetical protein